MFLVYYDLKNSYLLTSLTGGTHKMERKIQGPFSGPVGIAWIKRQIHHLEEDLADYRGPCGPDDHMGDQIDFWKGELINMGVNPWALKKFDGYRHDAEFAESEFARALEERDLIPA